MCQSLYKSDCADLNAEGVVILAIKDTRRKKSNSLYLVTLHGYITHNSETKVTVLRKKILYDAKKYYTKQKVTSQT